MTGVPSTQQDLQHTQWRNRQGGKMPPRLLTGKFLLTYREKRGKREKKKENGAEKKKNQKREGGKSYKMRRGLLFLFVWVYQNGNFLPEKSISQQEKKIRKNDFAPSEKYSSYAPEHTLKVPSMVLQYTK